MKKHLKNVLQASAAALALLAMSSPTSAMTMKAVYEGTVLRSDDQTNLFGQGLGSALDGLAYTLTYIYDTTSFGPNRVTSSDQDLVIGGASTPFPTPILSTTLTIAGHSKVVNGNFMGNVRISSDLSSYETSYHFAHDRDNQIFSSHENLIVNTITTGLNVIPINLDTPFVLDTSFIIESYGNFSFYDSDNIFAPPSNSASGALNPTSLTVSRFQQTSEVPAPAALPMLASGFGVFGLMARRRAKKRAAA